MEFGSEGFYYIHSWFSVIWCISWFSQPLLKVKICVVFCLPAFYVEAREPEGSCEAGGMIPCVAEAV